MANDSERTVFTMLRERYPAPEWAFFPHVRNGTGHSRRTTRTADALVLNLYPSRGLTLYGFEVKASRSDWLRELAQPEKADEWAPYCDGWYVVATDTKIVERRELPAGWGLLVVNGHNLVPDLEAIPREAKPLDRAFVAALLRVATAEFIPRMDIDARVQQAHENGLRKGRARFDPDALAYRLGHSLHSVRRVLDDIGQRIEEAKQLAGAAREGG